MDLESCYSNNLFDYCNSSAPVKNEKRKIMVTFPNNEWQKMLSLLTGKRLSFKVEFTNNLSLRLQQAGKKNL